MLIPSMLCASAVLLAPCQGFFPRPVPQARTGNEFLEEGKLVLAHVLDDCKQKLYLCLKLKISNSYNEKIIKLNNN